jgi:hypothetical protein
LSQPPLTSTPKVIRKNDATNPRQQNSKIVLAYDQVGLRFGAKRIGTIEK